MDWVFSCWKNRNHPISHTSASFGGGSTGVQSVWFARAGVFPSGEEPVRELELKKAKRAWGLGLRLGWGPFGEPGEISAVPVRRRSL